MFFDSWLSSCARQIHTDSARTSVDFCVTVHLQGFPCNVCMQGASTIHLSSSIALSACKHTKHGYQVVDDGWIQSTFHSEAEAQADSFSFC